MMRRVFVITYFFPPLGGGGIQRTLKYVRYLPDAGWQPIVITARDPGYEIRDPALLRDVPPGTEVRRSFVWEPSRAYRWLVAATGYARWRARREELMVRSPATSAVERAPTTGPRRVGFWADLSRYLIFPDDQATWLPFGVRSALRDIRTTPEAVLYSTSPPITAHLIAGILKRRTGLPWVADFRDPWIGNAFALPLPRLHRLAQRRLERWIVSTADRCVFATPTLTAMYQRRYPSHAGRFVTITNGYDRRDYPARIPGRDPDHFRLVYAGSLYGEEELAIFLDGLRRLLARRPDVRPRLRVEFVGWLSGHNRALAEHALSDTGLREVLTFTGFRPRSEALGRLASADAALHLLAGGPGRALFVGAKIFDYLALDLPILAVVPPGDVRTILADLRWGITVDPDAASVADGLERLIETRPGPRRADPEGRYDRTALARQLGALFGDVVSR